MCMVAVSRDQFGFPIPVDMGNTHIAVGVFGGKQFTAYQMRTSWENGRGSFAPPTMILPVWGHECPQFLDLSGASSFFDELEAPFKEKVLRGRGVGPILSLTKSEPTLEVFQVGPAYKVSFAPTLEDLSRLDGSLFFVQPELSSALKEHYSEGFGFVCVTLGGMGVLPYPLAYLSDAIGDSRVFIPTRHEHGDVESHDPDWDHTVTVLGQIEGSIFPLGETLPGVTFKGARFATFSYKVSKTLKGLATLNDLGVLKPYTPSEECRGTQIRVSGRVPNTDLWVNIKDPCFPPLF